MPVQSATVGPRRAGCITTKGHQVEVHVTISGDTESGQGNREVVANLRDGRVKRDTIAKICAVTYVVDVLHHCNELLEVSDTIAREEAVVSRGVQAGAGKGIVSNASTTNDYKRHIPGAAEGADGRVLEPVRIITRGRNLRETFARSGLSVQLCARVRVFRRIRRSTLLVRPRKDTAILVDCAAAHAAPHHVGEGEGRDAEDERREDEGPHAEGGRDEDADLLQHARPFYTERRLLSPRSSARRSGGLHVEIGAL